LGLATVSLDVAGRRVSLSMRDRGYREARELVEELPLLCRQARELAKVADGGSQNAAVPPDSPAHPEPEPPPATSTAAG
jgi:hypothetical protein